MSSFPSHTRLAVIGGGAMGVSLLYHLTKLGWSDVVLLEKNELTAGSTWHAAGLCTHFAHNLTVQAIRAHSVKLYSGILEEETGSPVSFHNSGALRITRSEERMAEFRHVRDIGLYSGYDFNMPEELQYFWDKWYPAREAGDQERMDKLAKDNREEAEDCLDLLLDDLSKQEIIELHHEVRSLAWALDSATRSERYITRVRLVLELEMRDRVRRYRAKDLWFKAVELEEVAQKERVFDAWETWDAKMGQYLG